MHHDEQVVSKFLTESNILVAHQIDSYNHFITTDFVSIIESSVVSRVVGDTQHTLTFSNVCLAKPRSNTNIVTKTMTEIYPKNARYQNLTYASDITMDIHWKIKCGDQEQVRDLPNIPMGSIPIMVRSMLCRLSDLSAQELEKLDECPYELGGYFIVRGNEKVCFSQERLADNKLFVFDKRGHAKFSYYAEIKSVDPITHVVYGVFIKFMKNGTFRVKIPQLTDDVCFVSLIKMLRPGITDVELIDLCIPNEGHGISRQVVTRHLLPSMESSYSTNEMDNIIHKLKLNDAYAALTTPDAITKDRIHALLQRVLVPHTGPESMVEYLCYMVSQIILTLEGKRALDDRDHLTNKRIDTTGVLMARLTMQLFQRVCFDFGKLLTGKIPAGESRAIEYFKRGIKSFTLTNGFIKPLLSGSWTFKNGNMPIVKNGTSHTLNRFNYFSVASNLRVVYSDLDPTSKMIRPRQLHPSQMFCYCPNETPEGENIGITKNLALASTITIHHSSDFVCHLLKKNWNISLERKPFAVFVNSKLVGYADDIETIASDLRTRRRQGRLVLSTSIRTSDTDLHVWTCAGRIMRPVLVVDNEGLVMDRVKCIDDLNWNDLTSKTGALDYVDAEELENCTVAINRASLEADPKRYTHMELSPTLMLGVCTSLIPFANHNQSPRVTYAAAMYKQAIGKTCVTDTRLDTTSHSLMAPQKPLVSTRTARLLNNDVFASGQNCIVAFGCFTGFNQEDSLLMNQSAIDRGLFTSFHSNVYSDEERRNTVSLYEEKFCNPTLVQNCTGISTKSIAKGTFSALDASGLVPLHTNIRENMAIIGKVTPENMHTTRNVQESLVRESSTFVRPDGDGVVDLGVVTKSNGANIVKVRVRQTRTPQIGDKFASFSAQKGVIGMVLPHGDMPTTEDGIVPDIIVNSHAIPSRMTMAQLLEMLLGKTAALNAELGDGTPFEPVNMNHMTTTLESNGFQKYGNETMYHGQTGERMNAQLFIGPCFYQCLKHMVRDKIYSRSFGALGSMTRQPAKGRSQNGGLRFGEMERDVMIAHGASGFLYEKLFTCSDTYYTRVCDGCGLIVSGADDTCRVCIGSSADVSTVGIPYASKLFLYELMCMGIRTKLVVDT